MHHQLKLLSQQSLLADDRCNKNVYCDYLFVV